MKKLNQLKNILTTWFENHRQISSVYYSDDFDFNAERNINYPVSNIEWMESNVNGKKTTHTYKIILADLLDDNIKGHEDEIFSDMMLIAEDLFAWAQDEEGFEFSKSINIQKFVDDAGDRTAGITFRIQISTVRSQNVCASPMKL
ncbi:MAG: hypothetical protein H7321_00445 [Bacteroidia bacterium]|nr:hypothetical protein [Bacteroidia bacterium]